MKKTKIPAQPKLALTLEEQMEQDRERRAVACTNEINAVLKKWNCQFSPITTIEAGGIMTQVRVVAV